MTLQSYFLILILIQDQKLSITEKVLESTHTSFYSSMTGIGQWLPPIVLEIKGFYQLHQKANHPPW